MTIRKKINLVIIINELDLGGAQHMVYELTKNIDYNRFILTIICSDGKTNSLMELAMLQESFSKYSIIFLNKLLFRTRIIIINRILNKFFRIFLDIHSIMQINKQLNIIKPDIIHAHQNGIWAGYWAIKNKIPILTTIHSSPESTNNRLSEKIVLRMSLIKKSNTLVAISQLNYYLVKKYWNYDKICYINNGIDINAFYKKPHKNFTFINVSRQDINKNQIMIINAFYRLYSEDPSKKMLLYLVGDGPCNNLLIKKVDEYKLNKEIIFTGNIESPKDYLAISDVYLSSSHREGLSLSALEAIASNLPIISTSVGGMKELVKENGILINDNDEIGLYSAMKELRDNKKLRLKKAKKSSEIINDYSSSKMTKQYCSLYKELIYK